MILSARNLRDFTPAWRPTREECVRRCAVCAETTPHVRVVRARPLLTFVALVLGSSYVVTEAAHVTLLVTALASVALWLGLRRRDRSLALQCVRCMDRARPRNGYYVIDFLC